MSYNKNFDDAVSHAMKYEVGGFWNPLHPAVNSGDISTSANRKATGYVNDPVDRGGETKFGIAKNANPSVNIAKLKWDEAKQIYYDKYWLTGKCDNLPKALASIHFDACINHGVGRANKMLQQALGVVVDGAIGPKTLAAAKAVDQRKAVTQYATIRRNFYHSIVKNNPSQAKFLNGWLRRIDEVEAFAKM